MRWVTGTKPVQVHYNLIRLSPSEHHVAAGPRFLNGYNSTFSNDVGSSVAAGPRFLNGYNRHRPGQFVWLLRLAPGS